MKVYIQENGLGTFQVLNSKEEVLCPNNIIWLDADWLDHPSMFFSSKEEAEAAAREVLLRSKTVDIEEFTL